jgi:methanogenic corrinoid protein MtbC1
MSLRSDAIESLNPEQVIESENRLEQLRQRLPEKDVRALAEEVIRRMTLLHEVGGEGKRRPDSEEIEALAQALISKSPEAALDHIVRVSKEGADIEAIYLDFLSPAARRLGEFWEKDLASFAEVTIGVGRIYSIMRHLMNGSRPRRRTTDRSAVIAALPDEQHSLGAQMATDLARLEGWEVRMMTGSSNDEIIDELLRGRVAVLGVTITRPESLGKLAKLIASTRIADPTVRILVSGRLASLDREAIDLTGPDTIATNFPEAIAELERLHDESDEERSQKG